MLQKVLQKMRGKFLCNATECVLPLERKLDACKIPACHYFTLYRKKKWTDKHVHVCEYETQEFHCAPVEKQVDQVENIGYVS